MAQDRAKELLGIGCTFDDPVHRVFGIEDLAFQSLHHFTVGGRDRRSSLVNAGAVRRQH